MRRSRHRNKTLPRLFPPSHSFAQQKSPSKRSYAFVEFRSRSDAEDAYYDMYVFVFFGECS